MRDDLPTYDPRRSRSLHPQNQVWRGETACERRPKLTRGTTAALKKGQLHIERQPSARRTQRDRARHCRCVQEEVAALH